MREWWYAHGEQRKGPVDEAALKKLLLEGTVSNDTLVWQEGADAWEPLHAVPALAQLQKKMPPPLPARATPMPAPALASPPVVQPPVAPPPMAPIPGDATAPPPGLPDAEPDPVKWTPPPSTPWRRFFARLFDVWAGGFVVSTLMLAAGLAWPGSIAGLGPYFGLFWPFAMLLIVMVLEAVVHALFGNTAGKALLGIRVVTTEGARPGFWRYLDRNVSVWVSGLCAGIPLLSFITMWNQARRVGKGEPASYDAGSFQSLQGRLGLVRVALFCLLCFLVLMAHVVLDQIGDHLARTATEGERATADAAVTVPDTSAALAGVAGCAQLYYGGRAPEITNPKLAQRSVALCSRNADVRYSPVTYTPLWSAEHLSLLTLRVAAVEDTIHTAHVDARLPASDRSNAEDFEGSGFTVVSLTAQHRIPTSESRYHAASYASAVPLGSDLLAQRWQDLGRLVAGRVKSRDGVYVISGVLFEGDRLHVLNDRLLIPTGLYLAFYDAAAGVAGAYVLDNTDAGSITTMSLHQLEARAGINLFPALEAFAKSSRLDLPLP